MRLVVTDRDGTAIGGSASLPIRAARVSAIIFDEFHERSLVAEPALVSQRYLSGFRAHASMLENACRALHCELHTFLTSRALDESLVSLTVGIARVLGRTLGEDAGPVRRGVEHGKASLGCQCRGSREPAS